MDEKMGLPEAPVYSCAFESWQANDQFHSPDVFVFDKNGKFIPYKDSLKPNCSGPAELFLAYLDPTHEYHLSDQYSIDTFYQLLNTTSCEKINYLKKEAVDFHIFITFTKWQGMYLQKNKTLVWLDSLSKNENIKYELVFVNTDLQDCWSESQKQFFKTR
ncbi:MAG: hypothetical protein IPP71_16315 [Bacteroidetes bacterium]|nr:hypothetical protein [Bacteroidota bacterium]